MQAIIRPYSLERLSFGVSNLVGVPKLFNIQDPVIRADIRVIARMTASSSLTCKESNYLVMQKGLKSVKTVPAEAGTGSRNHAG